MTFECLQVGASLEAQLLDDGFPDPFTYFFSSVEGEWNRFAVVGRFHTVASFAFADLDSHFLQPSDELVVCHDSSFALMSQ
ncbi:hypothetical protein HALA3H3_790030 [Halomonas sp. A3H3]|nr:hypothetical protein HALA3H3_790030 [Halomonas sp. A3H3]